MHHKKDGLTAEIFKVFKSWLPTLYNCESHHVRHKEGSLGMHKLGFQPAREWVRNTFSTTLASNVRIYFSTSLTSDI
jgi:hypothetical protein